MRKTLVIITIVMLLALPLSATSYPKLTTQYELRESDVVPLEQETLQAFIQEWQDSSLPTFTQADQMLREALNQGNLNLEQLQVLYRMQAEQLAYQKKQQGFTFGLTSSPLYSLSRTSNYTTGSLTFDTRNTFGVGASVSKKFATGASATLSVKQSSSYAMNSASSTWDWTHSPSIGLSVAQPLWVGDGLLDTKYGAKQLEKQSIAVQNSRLTVDQLKTGLVSQGNSQLVL